MNRRGFLIGTLLSGAAFYCRPLLNQPKVLSQQDALRRLMCLNQAQLIRCKLLYIRADDELAYYMPGLQDVIKTETRSGWTFCFKSYPLNITTTSSWVGVRFLDNIGNALMPHYSPFSGGVTVVNGDTLKATYTLNVTRS